MRHPLDSKTKSLITQRAQLMRAHPTWPEQELWLAIRAGQLGTPFRRQYLIGRFITRLVMR